MVPSQPMITAAKPYAISARGQNATLRCNGFHPTPVKWQVMLLWERDGRELGVDATKRISSAESYDVGRESMKFNFSLTISNVSMSDSGIYDCILVSALPDPHIAPRDKIQLILNQTGSSVMVLVFGHVHTWCPSTGTEHHYRWALM